MEGEEVLQALELRLPCRPCEDHGEAAVALQLMKVHLQPMEEPCAGAGGCLKEAVTLWEASCSWQGSVALCRKDPMQEQVCCSLWEGLILEMFMKDCLSWKGPHAGSGKSVKRPSPEEEGVAETMCNELTTAPISHPPVPLGEGR
ncbi:hypothetical protein WISP_148783 [Willisornis vidua]|uniref:Uncharacterized protein n=1 Tax=Willisornis vidua TaxID=1566151 RepID=A0ABQ9CQ72_9PASS|nr:hypothetical protein WISP_148783 [Willisornis vidua]